MPGPTPSQPGWYADGEGQERWYDGNGWTDHVRGADLGEATVVVPTSTPATGELPQAEPTPNQLAAPAQLQVGRGLRIALAVGGVLLLIAIAVVGGIVLLGDDEKSDKAGDDTTSDSTSGSTATDDESSLDVPTIDSSDFPTDAPTEDSTDESTDAPDLPDPPSGLPTGFPSDFPTFPTDPSDLDSWFSDYLEQVNP